MKNLSRNIGFLVLLCLLGCSKERQSRVNDSARNLMAPPATEKSEEPVERKLIKNGNLEFETENLNSARKIVFEAVTKYKGYVSSDEEFKSPGRRSNTVVVRVPAADFDSLLKESTLGVGKFDRKEINIKDVTEEFLDVEARLKTKKELEKRYLDLLKQAKNVAEMLEIEKQVGELRSDIESMEGRLKYLQSQVSFSTLTMTFYEKLPNETEFGTNFKNGFRNGWENLIWFFVMLVNIWPFILIGAGLVAGTAIYRRRKKDPSR